jgi:asparagine synthase (glutamine-hydrolysing)
MLGAQASYAAGLIALGALGAASFGALSRKPQLAGGDAGRSPSAHLLIVADVRLDNRQELIGRLGPGSLPSDADDSRILLAAWTRWKASALDFIVGEYAFAIYDHGDRALILARDCTGDRPLFFARTHDRIAFASMPSGLRAIAAHPPSRTAIAAQLAGHSTDDVGSVFTGIERVHPGELVRLTRDSSTRADHWQPRVHAPDQSRTAARPRDAEYVERYRHLLDQAVACRLPGDGSLVASQLSSGWDSNAVTGTAAQLHRGGIIAFTAAPADHDLGPLPRGRIADESPFAAITAERHAIDHVIVRETAPLFDVVRRQSALLQTPVTSAFNLAWWEAIRNGARDRGATHLLTGELGNYTLNAGGLPILAEWVRRGSWRTWWREARAAARRPDVRWRGIMVNSFGHLLPSPAMVALRSQFLGIPPKSATSFLRDDWREQVERDRGSEVPSSADPYLARLAAIRRSDPGLVRKSAFAQAGITELDPTADRRLIEFSLALPPEQLFRDGRSRPLARAALADRVPAAILDLKVRGLQAANWFLHFRPAEAQEVLEEIEPHPAVRDLLDIGRMKRAVDAWPDRGWNSELHVATYGDLMNALAAGLFLTQFSDQPP